MTLETCIPSRAQKVLELTGEAPEGTLSIKDSFLAIQPGCDYRVAPDLTGVAGDFNAILARSPLIGTLESQKLVEVIRKLGERLKPGGLLIFALDNIGYAENLATILAGEPPLFRTLLTVRELEQALAAARLHPVRRMGLSRQVRIDRGLAGLVKTDPSVFSHVLTAMRDVPPPTMLVQSLLGEKKVCAPLRIQIPNTFLAAEPNVATLTQDAQPVRFFEETQFKHRVFINQRVIASSLDEGLEFIRQFQQKGYLYLHEMDDYPFLRWKRYEGSSWINFIGAHAIQTSTPYLADFFRQFNPYVRAFPNQLPTLPPPRDFAEEARDPKRPVTLFFGALNRDEDFLELTPALNALAGKYGDRIFFKIIARRPVFDALASGNKTYVGDINRYEGQLVPYKEYQQAIRSSDIALLPLKDTLLNRGKSDLKFIECAGNGAVALASPVVYADVIKDGETGFLYHSEKEFVDKLELLIENGEKRRAVAEAAYQYVKHNRLMSQHFAERLDWYRECLAKLPDLNTEAQERIAEIPLKKRVVITEPGTL